MHNTAENEKIYKPIDSTTKALAFTMAEILMSLSIIGVIAAIILPSLRANVNEKTWATQRKVLYSRMSQALAMMRNISGYGDYEGRWNNNNVTVTKDTAAVTFITEGLSKVMQINSICPITFGATAQVARKELAKCGVPAKVTTMKNITTGRTNNIDFPTRMSELNPMFTSTYTNPDGVNSFTNPQHDIDTRAAAFETRNGETIVVFYNPYCTPINEKLLATYIYPDQVDYLAPHLCANFVYDLNGKKGPNKLGSDIGFITALFPISPSVVAPMPVEQPERLSSQTGAAALCRQIDDDSRVPNRNELAAMFYNEVLIGINSGKFWSSSHSIEGDNRVWSQTFNTGRWYLYPDRSEQRYVRCVKR